MQSTIAQSAPDILTDLIYGLLKADLTNGLTFLVEENYFDPKLAFKLLFGNELKRSLLIGQAVDELIARDETKANALIQLMTSCRRQFTDIRDRVVEAYDERVCERCRPSATKMAIDFVDERERESELSEVMVRVKNVKVEDTTFSKSCDELPSDGNSKSPTGLISMQSERKVVPATELKRSDRIYKMTAKPRGFCVIINNVDFENHKRRDGSDVEAEFLESIFDQLYFEVKVHRNLKRDQMLNTLEAVAKDPKLANHDAFVCIILSHGVESGPMGVDAETVPLDKLKVDGIGCPLKTVTEIFSNQHCPNLKNKPKMFFIQACRGDEIDEGVTYDGNTHSDRNRSTQNESQKRIPKITDMYVCWPSRDGQLALRNPKTGSWFGNTLGEVIRDHAWEYHLGDIMEEVTDRLKCRIGCGGCMQSTCVYQIGWSKKLYFNPALHLSDGMNQSDAPLGPGNPDRGPLKSDQTLSSEEVIRDSNGVDINSKISPNDKGQDVHRTRSTSGMDVSEKANCLDKKLTDELQDQENELMKFRFIRKAVHQLLQKDQAKAKELINALVSSKKIETTARREQIFQPIVEGFCTLWNIGATKIATDHNSENTNFPFNKIELDIRGTKFLDIKLPNSVVAKEQPNLPETGYAGSSVRFPSASHSYEANSKRYSNSDHGLALSTMKLENLVRHATFLRNSDGIYKMTSNPRGYCIIMNNVNYWHHPPRSGSDREANFLTSIFEQLFFVVKLMHNRTGHQMLAHLEEVAHDPALSYHDALVCIILSHGSEHGIMGVDGKTVPLETLIEPFNNKNCPRLINKPKMFFVTACRGGKLDNGVTIDGGVEDDTVTDGSNTIKIPTLTDTYICCASSKGSVAIRNVDTGSWFGNALGEVIRDHAWEHHLDDMMKMVYSFFVSKFIRFLRFLSAYKED